MYENKLTDYMLCLISSKQKVDEIIILGRDYIKKIMKINKSIMQFATDILPEKLQSDKTNMKYGACTFQLQSKHYNKLHNTLLTGVKEELRLYPQDHSNHGAQVTNRVDYLGDDECSIYKGSKDPRQQNCHTQNNNATQT